MSSVRTPDEVDILVIGGGMAGLSAAVRALQHGLRVMLVEKAAEVGGSARYAGYLWSAPSHGVMDEVNPQGDRELRSAVVEGFASALEFVRDLGVPCGPGVAVLRSGIGHQFDTSAFIETCRSRIAAEGELLLGVRTERLCPDGEGRVRGAELVLPDGTHRTVRAGTTVLATGGFQADPELRSTHVHRSAATIPLRSNPHSTGEGLRLAEAVGGAVVNSGGGFYGHLVPTGVALTPELFVELALYYSEHALLFNLHGERFVDETLGDHLTTMALVAQPEARGLLVTDAKGYREHVLTPYVEGGPANDKFALAGRRGARAVVADSVEDFASMPPEWGYDGERIAAELARTLAGDPVPGRAQDPRPLGEPPYYVLEATAAITFPFAGIRVDGRGRVLTGAGDVVPGLHSAGSDIGGLYRDAYAGGLAPAAVLGLAAADAATDVATDASILN